MEIEGMALARVNAIADPSEAADPGYAEHLRAAVAAAVGYGLAAIEHGDGPDPPIPVELLAQARIAARNGVSLDTVLRRYIAGYSLLGYFLIEEASRDGLMSSAELQRLVASQGGLFDRLLAAVGEEHTRESEERVVASGQRLTERIERLLAGEPAATADIAYDFAGWHLGLVATGGAAERSIRDLAAGVECRPLVLRRTEGLVWAWLGARRPLDPEDLVRRSVAQWPDGQSAAFGEPAEGLAGWRLTHRQAAAALSMAQRRRGPVVRYADVALLASVFQDELLLTSLRNLYLAPLGDEPDSGATLRRTLDAYLKASGNVSSAAALLGVKRHTVTNRLRAVEKKIGRPIDENAAEIEAALELQSIGGPDMAVRT